MADNSRPGLLTLRPMTPLERRSVSVLASIYGLRILGLFLILPVFAVYAGTLAGTTPVRVGWALGAYGLTQALLQIPLGTLSDRVGRKPVIVGGLLVFILGSVLAATAHTITGVIVGRAVQGAGAIAATIMALVADLTREEQRTKAMAAIGITIGAAFILSMMLSPVLNNVIGVPGMFWLTAALASLALIVFISRVPTPKTRATGQDRRFGPILKDRQLLRLDGGIFVLHLVMTAMFVALPPIIVAYGNLPLNRHWVLYLPVMLLALVSMAPFVRGGSTEVAVRPRMMGATAILVAAELIYHFFYQRLGAIAIGLWLFFSAFSVLEAMLPSLISRLAPAHSKGTAIGVYSTSQFFGAFVGGVGGGFVSEHFGGPAVFLASAVILGLWFFAVWSMKEPRVLTTTLVPLTPGALADPGTEEALSALPGVVEVIMVSDQALAYLRVDPHVFDPVGLAPYRTAEPSSAH